MRKPIFEPEKIQNLVSESEFMQMRNELPNAGGKWFTAAKVNYALTIIHAILCLLFFAAKLIADKFFDEKIFQWSKLVQIANLTLPNIILQICMNIFMKKACVGVQKFFDLKNEEIYTARGINWFTCGTLVYIHIRIIADESDLKKFDKSQVLFGISEGEIKAFEVTNSNREILMKKYQDENLMPK